MIREEDDTESLQNYSNQVINILSIISLCFTNGKPTIDTFIIVSGYILNSVINNNEINICDMSTVQLLAPLLEHNEVFDQLKKN